jgi:hypothetical protein
MMLTDTNPNEERKEEPKTELFKEPFNVQALLILKNIRQKDLAKKYFIHPSVLNRVIKGRRKTHHVRQAIANELNMGFQEVWGEPPFSLK